MLPRQDQPPLGVGESASVPSAAAIANAIFDATGVRFRELPFTPERILAGLRGEQGCGAGPDAAGCAAAARCDRPMAKSVCRPARRLRDRRRTVRCRRWRRNGGAAVEGDRADRAAGPSRPGRPPPSPAASNWPRSATARSATPWRTASSTPGAGHRDAVRHHLRHQHHARRRNRNRRVVLPRLRARHARGHPSRRPASLSGVSLYPLRQNQRRRPAGALRISDGAAGGARRDAGEHVWRFRSTCGR